jgi:hypothetical protein
MPLISEKGPNSRFAVLGLRRSGTKTFHGTVP